MKFYTHNLSLIERTKLLEGVVCQSLAFTDKLAEFHPENMSSALIGVGSSYEENLYKTPVYTDTKIGIVSLHEFINANSNSWSDRYMLETTNETYIEINMGNLNLKYGYLDNEANTNLEINITDTLYLKYNIYLAKKIVESEPEYTNYTVEYKIYSFKNHSPTKPWTITSGINRVLDLAEPLFLGDTPRFILNPIQAQKWEDTPLPNTTMTQCTLREQLQHIGNYVHSQARLGGYLTENITYNGITYNAGYYENMIFFDEYGQEEESTLQGKPYVSNQIRHSINEYNTQIDTTAQNIVNTLDYSDGVIVSPDAQNFKTVRTEGVNIRLGDNESTIIATELPIYDVISVKCKAFNTDGSVVSVDGVSEFDITPFIFERHTYNSVLQSYGGGYPYSKSYAVYYAQGEKNIRGLFFKATTEPSAIFGNYVANYSIVNILESVAPSYDWKNYVTSKFPLLAFQVSYIPFYQTRYSHTDGYIIGQGRKLPFTKIYNQSENVIETRFYGENIKGVAMRLGNQEATRTYYLGSINDVAKVGTMLDGYYISQAVTEYMPQSIRCTVGLTKHFNRLSQNVGINSHKRVAEVSEREAYQRNILIKEYICIGSNEELPLKPSHLQENVNSTLDMIIGAVAQDGSAPSRLPNTSLLTVAILSYLRKDNNLISCIKAPVVSSAFGNCMTFSWAMKDNYSAGEEISTLENGYWQRDVAYSDYYGRAYMLDFMLTDFIAQADNLENALSVVSTPFYKRGGIGTNRVYVEDIKPYMLRKDSREIINMNVAIEYISNRQDLILGSALASCNPWVSNLKKDSTGKIIKPKIYYFGEKISQYDATIIGKSPVFTDSFSEAGSSSSIVSVPTTMTQALTNSNYQSWCIAYEPVETTTTVYNEDTGENEQYTTYTGGEILVACNNSVDYYLQNNIDIEFLYIKAYSDKYKDYEG